MALNKDNFLYHKSSNHNWKRICCGFRRELNSNYIYWEMDSALTDFFKGVSTFMGYLMRKPSF